MQYDQPITGTELDTIMENLGLSPELQDAVLKQLGVTDPNAPLNVSNSTFDPATGQLTTVSPTGEIQVVLITVPNAPGGAGLVARLQLGQQLSQHGVFIIDSSQSVELTFNTVERVIASGSGDDLITVNGDKDTTLDGGAGNDTLVTSGGNDSVVGNVGNDKISTFAGRDTVDGGLGNDSISTGSGNDTVIGNAGNDTVDTGSGYQDVLDLRTSGVKSDYQIATTTDGKLLLIDTQAGEQTIVSNTEIIQFASETATPNVDSLLIVTGDHRVADVMRLYDTVLGREADFQGAQFWTNEILTGNKLDVVIANDFLHSPEFVAAHGDVDAMSNTEFVELMYSNMLDRPSDPEGLNFWLGQLDAGKTRADVALLISGTPESASNNADSVQFIDGWV